jgi:phosphoacetylglucosamine mutase
MVNETLVDEIRQLHERPAKVVFARDTRASGPYLVTALKAALDAVKVEYTDYGIMTTPQLHYIVRCVNTMNSPYAFGEPTEQGYYEKMAKAFKTLMYGRTIQGSITVDCANGVGGPKLKELIKYLPSGKEGGIDIKVVNDDVVRPEALNFEVRGTLLKGFWLVLTVAVRCRLCQDQTASSAQFDRTAWRSLLFT